MSYILFVKLDDHKMLMEWVNEQWQLNGNKKTIQTNYVEYSLISNEGKV